MKSSCLEQTNPNRRRDLILRYLQPAYLLLEDYAL